MYFSKFVVWLWFAALFTSTGMGCASAADGLRPYTIDEALKLEATGSGLSCGGKVIWEQAPPYEQVGDYSFDHVGLWQGGGFQLKFVDLNDQKARPKHLFKPNHGTVYFLTACSPDERYVVYFGVKQDDMFMGVYDLMRSRNKIISITPVVDWVKKDAKVFWVSPNEFVVATYAADERPLAVARPHVSNVVSEAQKRAWAGGLSADILDNRHTLHTLEDGLRWKPGQIYKVNAKTGKAALFADGLYESLKTSADGRYLAALRQAEPSTPDPNKPADHWVQSKSKLVLFDLRLGGASRFIAPEKDVSIEALAWAPDHNRLAFFAWDEGAGMATGIYQAYDADTNNLIAHPHTGLDLASERERGFSHKPERVLWVNGRLAVFARKHGGADPRFTYKQGVQKKADLFLLDRERAAHNLTAAFKKVAPIPLYADAQAVVLFADGNAWRVGPGRQSVNLTAGVGEELSLSGEKRRETTHFPFKSHTELMFRNPEGSGFVVVNFERETVYKVSSPSPSAELLAVSENGAVLFRDVKDSGVDLVLQAPGNPSLKIDRLNEHMADVRVLDWTPLTYEAETHQGRQRVTGCMLLPHDHDPKKRYPVILEVYPNSGDACTRTGFSPERNRMHKDAAGRWPQLMAAKGYIVFTPNLRRSFIKTPEGPVAGMPVMADAGIAALIAEGYADPDRVGMWGMSQGGFSSLWIASQSDKIKATVSLNGWADMYNHYFESYYLTKAYRMFPYKGAAGRYEPEVGGDFAIGKTPFEALDTYIRQSPLFNAPNFKAPVLLIHSDLDVFTLAQYEQMYTALNLQNKPARFVRYWGEGHSPSSPENMRHMWGEIFDWFDEYLGGPEPTEEPAAGE